jgi:hypothetical protein
LLNFRKKDLSLSPSLSVFEISSLIFFLGFCFLPEVTKGLWAKKQAKLKKNDPESEEKPERVKEKQGSGVDTRARRSEQEKKNQVNSLCIFLQINRTS